MSHPVPTSIVRTKQVLAAPDPSAIAGYERRQKRRKPPVRPKVNDGNRVTVEPCEPADLEVGDIVLVRVKGNDYLHLIKAIDRGRFLIGNNRGGTNGWVGPSAVYGRAARVERR